ncbi:MULTISPECIES: DNA repair exonuclease [unclassified Halanaerobium]|uniref:metallophosphoesterase family protein n=1 Tax=unclassified Halanaerobium TaxID=2641197 RepID=UPI000DF1E361|nr:MULTISPECIES: DNA repair exonuclease [unclassified Halanaerobium]RCW51436.1 calcineurin-like phosphoesterase family protein [Halanaerobium sp. MA284_MarDTE_T2]RCW89224.1 calcineurin-like phosphoesterase family protein [Halanaerobium sp. DL-01]
MKNNIKFIHAADIHLGSSLHYSGNYSTNIRNMADNALQRAWNNLIECCCKNEVDFLLLAGDILDSDQRSIKALDIFIDGCKRLSEQNIEIYMITGNHDSGADFDDLIELPKNLNIFSAKNPELKKFKKNGRERVNLIGQSYSGHQERDPIFENYIFPQNELLNIALLHTQLEGKNSKYVPVSRNELTAVKKVDYWALGHIHQAQIINHKNPAVFFSGNIQGRDFGEQLQGGALLVEFENKKLTDVQFLALSDTIYMDLYVDITGKKIKNLTEMMDLMVSKFKSAFAEMKFIPDSFKNNYKKQHIQIVLLRWIIKGRGDAAEILLEDEEGVNEYLTKKLNRNLNDKDGFFLTEEIVNLTENIFLDNEMENKIKESEIFREIDAVKNDLLNKEDMVLISEIMGEIWQLNDSSDPHYFEIDKNLIERLLNKAEFEILKSLFGGR